MCWSEKGDSKVRINFTFRKCERNIVEEVGRKSSYVM